jgi:SAM-dependent methyltransferase
MPADVQPEANDQLWESTGLVGDYANRTLRPVEAVLLVRFRDQLGGRVLELGCGAGRLTGYLAEISPQVEGLDVSDEMLAYARSRYPKARFRRGDIRDLSAEADGSRDVVVAGYNLPDILSDEDRGVLLDEVRRMLEPGGLFVFSTHNLGAADAREKPTDVRRDHPLRLAADLVRMPRRVRNSRRLRRSERHEPGYAILNDVSHDFRALHYYISRDRQERQLLEHGFELLECLDLDGGAVAPSKAAAHSSELHYVARRPR